MLILYRSADLDRLVAPAAVRIRSPNLIPPFPNKHMTEKAVATTSPDTAVALPFDYGEHAGAGMNISLDDLKIPFLTLVQDDSKVLFEDEEKYVRGGKSGDILNSATKVYTDGDNGLLLVPALIKTSMVEYLPDRGGFVAEHEMSSDVARAGKTENGNDLVKTKTMFAVVVDEEINPLGYVVVPFASSKLGPWSDYFTRIDTAKITKNAPIYANLIRLRVKDQKNAKGRFKNYDMFPARDESGALTLKNADAAVGLSLIAPDTKAFSTAVELRDAIMSGRAQADNENMDGGAKDGDTHF